MTAPLNHLDWYIYMAKTAKQVIF